MQSLAIDSAYAMMSSGDGGGGRRCLWDDSVLPTTNAHSQWSRGGEVDGARHSVVQTFRVVGA